MRLLIVDDNEDMRHLARLVLELAGNEVVAEADEACGAARAWCEHRPDVVVLDYRLPGHTGLEAAQYILDHDPDARVLLFSAYLDDATVDQAAALGVRGCVSKDQVQRLPEHVRSAAA